MEPRNALLVGGQKRCWDPLLAYLAQCAIQVHTHWDSEQDARRRIPSNVDFVIVITSQVSHALQMHAKSQAGDLGVPVNYVSHNSSVFPEQLKKWGIEPQPGFEVPVIELIEDEEDKPPAYPIEKVLQPMIQIAQPATQLNSVPTSEASQSHPNHVVAESAKESSMSKEDKELGSNQVRAKEKEDYVRELLKEDPAMSPVLIIDRVTAKFPGGMSKQTITEIRMQEHGIRIGPGGRVFDKKGKRMQELEHPRAPYGSKKVAKGAATTSTNGHNGTNSVIKQLPRRPEANVEASTDRLRQLVAQMKVVMESQGVQDLHILPDGAVRVRRSVEMELN